MISIKAYAKKNNITYEAARKQVSRYRKELENHISMNGRTRYLDDEAEAFLDGKRAVNPVIVVEQGKDDELADLRRQNENLQLKIIELQEQLVRSKDQVLERDQQLLELKDRLLVENKKPQKWWQKMLGM